jgi:hypothetical protein
MISVFELAKKVQALDCATTVIGLVCTYCSNTLLRKIVLKLQNVAACQLLIMFSCFRDIMKLVDLCYERLRCPSSPIPNIGTIQWQCSHLNYPNSKWVFFRLWFPTSCNLGLSQKTTILLVHILELYLQAVHLLITDN